VCTYSDSYGYWTPQFHITCTCKKAVALSTQTVTKNLVNEKVSNMTWHVPEMWISSVSVIWNVFLVHELLTVHHICTTVWDHCVLRCIFLTNIITIGWFNYMLFCMWKTMKPNRQLFMMAICAHILTVMVIVLHKSILHVHVIKALLIAHRQI
jgi:hypothetical protein